jgi:hypothetical protein
MVLQPLLLIPFVGLIPRVFHFQSQYINYSNQRITTHYRSLQGLHKPTRGSILYSTSKLLFHNDTLALPSTELVNADVPNFVQNVTVWLDSVNLSYIIRHLPLSTILCKTNNSIRTSLSQQPKSQQQNTLHIVQCLLPPSKKEPLHASVLFLHLIPSPTSLEQCLPAGVTQFMTNHPDIVNSVMNNEDDETEMNIKQAPNANIHIIHLHEDIWRNERTHFIVLARLLCRFGIVKDRIYARQTTVRRIDSVTARQFLEHHHLWGATHAKYAYGLFHTPKAKSPDIANALLPTKHINNGKSHHEGERLVAVATFSARRNVRRGTSSLPSKEQRIYRSYELIRICSCCDMMIVGGISKLLSAFTKECTPDDIVTVIDRDWGIGQTNWHRIGFETVAIMAPIPMVIKNGQRRHLIGSGIQSEDHNDAKISDPHTSRLGISSSAMMELESITSYSEAVQSLHHHGYHLVYDAGVERLILLISKAQVGESVDSLWKSSIPQYATKHYSKVAGINALIRHVSRS